MMKDQRSVKSAERVMELLEFFAERQAPATVVEISRALGTPQSSTSMLIQTLARLGYLAADLEGRGYLPTLRTMMLGTWLHDWLFGEGTLVAELAELRRRTGKTVLIGIRQGLHVRSVMALRGIEPNALRIRPGGLYPVCRSAMGKMLLGLEPDAEILRIARAFNAAAHAQDRINVQAVLDEVKACRVHRWSESDDYPLTGRGAVATLLPTVPGHPSMALAIAVNMGDLLQGRDGFVSHVLAVKNRLAKDVPLKAEA